MARIWLYPCAGRRANLIYQVWRLKEISLRKQLDSFTIQNTPQLKKTNEKAPEKKKHTPQRTLLDCRGLKKPPSRYLFLLHSQRCYSSGNDYPFISCAPDAFRSSADRRFKFRK